MKKQLLKSLLAGVMTFAATSAWADGYIVNAEFNPAADPIGWTKVNPEQFFDIGMYQIGGEQMVRFAAPTADETHLATEYAAGFECRWSSNYAAYTQTTVEIPAGAYALTFDVENVNDATTAATYENRFTVTVGETVYTDEATEWMKGKSAWTTHTIKFILTEAAPITISLGYGTGSNNIGAANTPALYVSHLTLGTFDPLADAKATLQTEIDAAKALLETGTAGKDELQAAINTAEGALSSATTAEAVAEAVETLKAAEAIFVKTNAIAANAALVAGASDENPVLTPFVVNGTFTDNVNGWTCTGGFQNRTRASNQQGDFTVPFFENWNPSAKVNKMYQTIANIPNGTYKLQIAAFVNTLANPNESQFVFANNDKVYLTTGEPTFYEVWTVVADNNIEIGLEQTEAVANWMGIDNVTLTYYGEGNVIETARMNEALAEAKALLAEKQSAKTLAALQAAVEAYTAAQNNETKAALDKAAADSKISVNSYKILETGIPDNSLAGWTCTTFVEGQDVRFQVNTWSNEGNSDGSGMVTPFIENWTPRANVLGVGEIYYTLPGLDPGIYQFSALIRAYSEAGNPPTGASLFAGDREKEFATGKNFDYNNMKGIFDIYAMTAQVGEDGIFRFGIKVKEDRNFNWMAFKSCKVEYVGAAITAETINELAAQISDEPMNAEVKAAALAAAETAKANVNLDNYEALLVAVAATQSSVKAYSSAKAALDAMQAVIEGTNVYTAEAFETYNGLYTAKKAAYEAATLTDADAIAIENPEAVTGWRAANIVDNFLLSAWDTQADFPEGVAYYINTWSVEGNNDGTNFKVPFFEYWTGDGDKLGEKTLTATIDGLKEGDVYDVTAWVRVRIKNGAEAPATGITLQVNEGPAVDVCDGEAVANSQFFLKEFTAAGAVDAEGKLLIKFNVAADNNVSWLSFKNVVYTYNEYVTVGIQNVATDKAAQQGIFNLAGQRVEKAGKGLYIINGKKVVK